MKKNIMLVVVCFMFILVCNASVLANNSIKWGATMQDVLDLEDSKFVSKTDHYLNFESNRYTLTSNLFYKFDNNKLILYVHNFDFWVFDDNYNLYLSTYRVIQMLVEREYGTPIANEICDWSNNKYRGDEDKLALAIYLGHTSIGTIWETNDTIIFLTMYRDGNKIVTAIMFKPIQ